MRTLLLTTLLAITAPAPAQKRSVVRERPFTVVCHFRDEAMAREALRLAKATWELGKEHLQPDELKLKKAKFEIHLYRDKNAYAAAGRRLGSDLYKVAQGFADGRSMSCHCLLTTDPAFAGGGLSGPTRTILIHETFHLAIYASGNAAFMPQWLSEGMPLWAEMEVSRRLGYFADPEKDAYEGRYTTQAQAMQKGGQLPTVDAIIQGQLDTLDRSQRYTAFRMLALFLSREKQVWSRVCRTGLQYGSSPASATAMADVLDLELDDKYATLEPDFMAFVKERKVAKDVWGWPAPDAVGKPGEEAYIPATPFVRWLSEHGKPRMTAKATLLAIGGSPAQADLVFGRRNARWLRLSLVSGDGVHLLQRTDIDGKPGPWQRIATHRDPEALALGQEHRVELKLTGSRIQVRLGSARVIDVPQPKGLSADGRWGVGNPARSQTRWLRIGVK